MTLYEELGVPPDASPEAIREAYRNVARLLHPDSQTNPALKNAAETQMKRLNLLHDILADAERRQRYDQEMGGAIVVRTEPPFEVPMPAITAINGNLVWLIVTTVCTVFVVWFATREPATPAVYPQPVPVASAPAVATKASRIAPDKRDAQIVWLWGQLNLEPAVGLSSEQREVVDTVQDERRESPDGHSPGG